MTWHRITVTDEANRIGVCTVCGPVPLRRRERRGAVEWSCLIKHRSYSPAAVHRRALGPHCEECGFVAVHRAQLDIHHLDGDHSNNKPRNLATLCANCHRLFHALGHAGLEEAERRRENGTERFQPEDEGDQMLQRVLRSRLRVWLHDLYGPDPDGEEVA